MGAEESEHVVAEFIPAMAEHCRVLVIGGLAVISHGLSRSTKVADVWMEPFQSAEDWADQLLQILDGYSAAQIVTLPGWRSVLPSELADAIEESSYGGKRNGTRLAPRIFRIWRSVRA